VAHTLADLVPAGGGLVLDLGAGTGRIGARLAAAGLGYVGLDLSLSMLGAFRARLKRGRQRGLLVQADADRPWPIASGTVQAIFASRAAHRLAEEHVVAEILRVADSRVAIFLLGRVQREPECWRAELRREMRRLLAEHGVEGRSGEQNRQRLIARLERAGGEALPARVVASWRVRERPADALAGWRGQTGLAGTAVEPGVRQEVLERLEAWAMERWGELEISRDATDAYELVAIRIPPQSGRGDA
jgi:SAM-dependent methyltransferase